MRFTHDVETWQGYVSAMESAYAAHTEGNGRVWLESFKGGSSFERAFVGPWHTVRAHVTTEFRQWLEEYGIERVTLTRWIQRARAERAREAEETGGWVEIEPGVWMEI